MITPVVFLFRPRHPGEALEVWHVAPRPGGNAEVLVERECPLSSGHMLGRPFGAALTRLAHLVEQEADRVLPAAQITGKRLRDLAKEMVA